MSQSQSSGSSPYATGGGGVQLEHEYAASALASLLLAQPIEGLGDDLTVTQVAMQQGAWSPVDDVIVQGIAPGGDRMLRVASRRHPMIGKSDPSTVKLFADLLQVVLRTPELLAAGRTRLGLAFSAPFGPASELSVLTDVARRQPDRQSFEQAVHAERAYTADVRARLKNVADVVEAALADGGEQSKGRVGELTWQLLKGLFVIPLQFEGDVAPGRTSLVARLQTVAGSAARAEDLRLRLVEIASQGAIRAGVITRPMLRAELRPFGLLDAAPDFSSARSQVALLESELRARTPPSVPVPGTSGSFTVDRSTLEARLFETIAAAPVGGVVIVHGEPDVGKSALALAAVDSIRASGGVALALSLRDLPSTPVSLKVALGLAPSDLFAAAPSAPVTAVVLDGAEVVQERDGGTAGALVVAATAAGKTTILVVRDDAVESLVDLLRARGVTNPSRFAVGSLSTSEIATLVAAVPDLARLATDPRANWLLSRLGLVELLLKTAQRGSNLPETLSSEAEVFATVWRSFIRQDERIVGGIAPDDRETAVVEVARQLLSAGQGLPLNGPALAMLRSDGVLVSYARSAAWQTGDRFASDVLRDFASARLFLRQGLSVLAGSSAPRWAVRATRLFAQARLASVANSGESTFAAAWTELRAEFASLAANHGARWAELPWEALLTAGWAGPALNALTPALLADSEMRGDAIRTATLRFSRSGACDAAIGAPLVGWLVDTAGVLNAPRSHHDEPAVEVVVAWLRGVARLDAAGEDISEFRSLRATIREALIAREIDRSDSERLEALALLGADHTDASRGVLRHIAQVAPGFLATVVENFDVAATMARHDWRC